jgi:uncharacterized membrane protein YczE
MSTRRLASLHAGLALYGVSVALMVEANLGLDSWDVLHQGLSRQTGIPLGWVIITVGLLVLLAWIPLRQRPGYGTVANVVLVGAVAELSLAVLPTVDGLVWRWVLLILAILGNAVATGMYVGAGYGPGPRDGLMTGIVARGHSIRVVRTAIELAVLALGWLLGGTVGIGTLLYALAIGPLVHRTIPLFTIHKGASDATPRRHRREHPSKPRRWTRRGLVQPDRP